MHPLRFEPFLRPMVWGGRRLAELGKHLPDDQLYGESWEVSDHPHHRSIVAEGPLQGQSLRTLMETRREELLGQAADNRPVFPWLIKFLDCRDRLSVQVHPDEEAVKTLWPGEGPKSEAWFVVDAQPGSRIWAGLKPGVDEKVLRDALARGAVADCLHSFEPRPGDGLYLPAGTVHAVGDGVLLAEIQQTSDATFRLYDWDRRDAQGQLRPLHIEQALASIHWEYGPVEPMRANGSLSSIFAKAERFFAFYHLSYPAPEKLPVARLCALMLLKGEGWLRSSYGENRIQKGQTWILPASLSEVEMVPESCIELLLFSL